MNQSQIFTGITPNTAYLEDRLKTLGIDDQLNTFNRVWYQNSSELVDGKTITQTHKQERKYKFFSSDEEGNIVIQYFNLEGQPYRWKGTDRKQMRDYIRKRLRQPKGDFKYWQESGSPQFPFFNPGILTKYQLAKHPPATIAEGKDDGSIDTLFVVEGEFKSFKGWMAALDIIGIPSIHGFYNGDVKGKLHEDIQELLITCKVKKIVFLVDADLLSVTWAENKDMAKRPLNFYAAVKSFRESLQLLLDDNSVNLKLCYFMHIETKYMKEDVKGLDDLLCKYSSVQLEITNDLQQLAFAKKYFHGMSILDQNKDVQGRVYRYLGLVDEEEFYKTYQEFIGAREFKFKRKRYEYDAESKTVKYVRHEDADKFMRIGPDWVKVITKPNKFGEKEQEIVSWKISEITRDYKKYPDFLDQIMKYDDFCNEPNWNGAFQRVINGCYNLCEPLRWSPKEGSIASSAKFIKHIFQGEGNIVLDDQGRVEKEVAITGDQFTVALDYLTIQLKHPKHMLPVPILVSPENGTGKSTFLKWLQMIFGANMCILGNAQFQMKFNGHYITKFIIAIDEGFLEVDKKAEKERLKQLVTADSVYLENKGQNVRKINYYGKLIICSNDADRVMKIDEGESRWFVVRVPVIPKEEMDPDLEIKLKEEAEAWLNFLLNRPIHHKRSHRLWFDPEHFITEQMKVIVEATKNRIDRVFEDWIREQFLLYKDPVLRYPLKYLTEVFNDQKNSKYKLDGIEIKAYLDKQGLKPQHPCRIKIPIGFDLPTDHNPSVEAKKIYIDQLARPYEFLPDKWLTEEQKEEYMKPLFDQVGKLVTKLEDTVPFETGKNDDLPF